MLQHTLFPESMAAQTDAEISFENFPSTRYQGSKRKALNFIWKALSGYTFTSALDLYSGTASVALLLRKMNKVVTANDFLRYNELTARLLLRVDDLFLSSVNIDALLTRAFSPNEKADDLFSREFRGIYFKDEENCQIDLFCSNLRNMEGLERDLAIYLMGQAMLMKRPYNLFHRANLSMRLSEVPRSFGNAKTWEGSFETHMRKVFSKLRRFEFSGPVGRALSENTTDLQGIICEPNLVYLDPPYLNRKGVPVDYVRYYHLLDGLVDYSLFSAGDDRYAHKPILAKSSNWMSRAGALREIENVARRWPRSILAISYRGDGVPTTDELKATLLGLNYEVHEHLALDYKYALSHATDASEDLLVAERR
jgi:adenine-specific DNA-methyltransferase